MPLLTHLWLQQRASALLSGGSSRAASASRTSGLEWFEQTDWPRMLTDRAAYRRAGLFGGLPLLHPTSLTDRELFAAGQSGR